MIEIVLTGVLSFIFGGSLIGYLKFYQDKRKDHLTFIESDWQRTKHAYETLRTEVDKLKLAVMPSAVPEWRKDIRGTYVYVSPQYEMYILLPLSLTVLDILGKTDDDVFADYPDFAAVLKAIDNEARLSYKKFAVRRNVQFPGQMGTSMVIKEISQTVDGTTYFIGRCYPE